MRRGPSPPHKQPGSPAPARWNPLNSPSPVLPLHTQLRSPRCPQQSRLSHGRARGPAAVSPARQLGRANCVTPSERPRPSPERLPPPAPAPPGEGAESWGRPLSPRGPHRRARTHRPAPLRGGPAPAGPNPSPASRVPVAPSAKPHGAGAREAAPRRAVLSARQRGGRRARPRRYSLTAAASECIFVQRCTRCRPGTVPALLPIQSLGTNTPAPPTARAHWSELLGDAARPALLLGEATATLPPPAPHPVPRLPLGRTPSRPRPPPL